MCPNVQDTEELVKVERGHKAKEKDDRLLISRKYEDIS
jgi:hypothetical protein